MQWFFFRGSRGFVLAFEGGAFEVGYAGEDQSESDDADDGGATRGKITDQQRGSTAECAEEIEGEDGAAMAEAEV